jgi:hypothetical protein
MNRDHVVEVGRAEQQFGLAGDRRDELGALTHERKTDIHVVEQHVLGRHVASVLDHILHGKPAAAHFGSIGAGQHQRLAICLRLCDPPDCFEHIAVVLPTAPEADELRRNQCCPVVHAIALTGTRRKIVARDVGVFGIADMHQPAGVVETPEPCPEPAEAALVLEKPGSR